MFVTYLLLFLRLEKGKYSNQTEDEQSDTAI
jgi:hypothetical protein